MYAKMLSAVLFCCLLSVNSYNLNGELAGSELAEAKNNEPVQKRDLSLMEFMTDVLDRLDGLQKQIDILAGKNKLESCPDGWHMYGKSCYYFSRHNLNWFDALTFCNAFKGHLAEINDYYENRFIKGKINDYSWIGATDLIKENHWIWVASQTRMTTSLFSDWSSGEPNNRKSAEHCLMAKHDIPDIWNDAPCFDSWKFICEREME